MICTNYQNLKNNSYVGKFLCPMTGMPPDKVYCCGDVNNQYCCSHMETLGAKWGLAVGIIIGVLILAVLAYTIHAIRALDRCYHECPACGHDETFKLDCRWYTVSNEGNRYGVTFHSRKFAKSFMTQLANRYGQWNQADILRIKRNGKDFVVLNIYFNDMFTPWFYTQGPMKNDTEWINSDFVDLVTVVKEEVRVPLCCARKKQSSTSILSNEQRAVARCDTGVNVRIDEPDNLQHQVNIRKKKQKHAVSTYSQVVKTMEPKNNSFEVGGIQSVEDLEPGSREYLQIRTSQWHRNSDGDTNVPSVIIEDVELKSNYLGGPRGSYPAVSRNTRMNMAETAALMESAIGSSKLEVVAANSDASLQNCANKRDEVLPDKKRYRIDINQPNFSHAKSESNCAQSPRFETSNNDSSWTLASQSTPMVSVASSITSGRDNSL